MSDRLDLAVGKPDRSGRRLVAVVNGDKQHRDSFDVDSSFHRGKWRNEVVERFRLSRDAHDWLERELIAKVDAADSSASEPVQYQRLTCRELDSGSFELDFVIEDVLVAGQPGVPSGPMKSGKTTMLIDAGISVATATRFLGRFDVPRARRVAIMTGESGLATVQETARRVCQSKGLRLGDIDGLIWSPDVPRFGNLEHADAVRDFCEGDEIELLILDPAYLCLPGADAGNLMIVGELLRGMAKVCSDLGVTLLLCHHTKKNTVAATAEPLELHDIAWAGFAEFARQWWLINRRERYEEGSGRHSLWLSLGGSAGHSGLYAVDIDEGVWSPRQPRHYEVTVENGVALLNQQRAEQKLAKRKEREESAEQQRDDDREKVWSAMRKYDKADTVSVIAGKARLNNTRTQAAIGLLEDDGLVELVAVTKGNGQSYDGWQLTKTTEVSSDEETA